MADITYTVNQDDPNSINGFEQFSQADKNLIGTFQVNNLFDSTKNLTELHILSLSDTLLESHYDYNNYKLLGNAQSAGKEGASIVTIDPIEDSKLYGYQYGGIKLLYHFLNDLYTTKKERTPFFVESISPDRTELRLQSLDLTNEDIKTYTQAIKDKLASQSYFNDFRLNFDNNDLFIGINIDVLGSSGNSYVVVKLYEPLPTTYDLKSTTYITEVISDSVAFEVDSLTTEDAPILPTLRSPNFNLDVIDQSVIPTGYYSYNDLFSYPVNNTNSQVFSLYSEKGAELSIDHSNYSNFVHFSSAYERLVNFKYKLQLIENYSSSLSQITTATSQSVATTGSSTYYNNLIQGVLDNFDHYERFLYYESSSYAWPKSNTVKPFINVNSTNITALNWYANQLAVANGYDLSNGSILINSIPSFLRDDPSNENYLTFIYMIGQHFDNLWIYGKAVTDKYNGDNRTNYGISKDLVGEALKNFGVKLYTSNKSIEDLFTSFIGQGYQSGSEVINYYITGSTTGSNIPVTEVSYDDYNKEVQKRIYHNLSHLLKTKGTERGLRALINCFGISPDILKIKQYGGRNTNERPFFGDYQSYSSSLDKIRLDNTGSLISGSTLSSYTSIVKRDNKYTDDLHVIEVGFSPMDNIDAYILANITGSFNIDNYIGNPSDLTSGSYTGLAAVAKVALSGSQISGSYDLQDYVRLIKFYDNTVFKMIKDFIPARVVADTGIIIKPNLLNRSKAKSVLATGSRPEHSGSIDTAFTEGGNSGEFQISTGESSTAYIDTVQTPVGLYPTDFLHNQEQPKFTGELSGSNVTITNGNLTANNPYTATINGAFNFGTIQYVSSSAEVCLLAAITPQIRYITSSTQQFQPSAFFNIGTTVQGTYNYSASDDTTSPVYTQVTPPFTFGNYSQYTDFYLVAQNTVTTLPCTSSIQLRYGTCSIVTTNNAPGYVSSTNAIDLTAWFNIHPSQAASVQYTASWNNGTQQIAGIPTPNNYTFTQGNGSTVTIIVRDPNLGNICQTSQTVNVGTLNIGAIRTGSEGLEFWYSYSLPANQHNCITDADNPVGLCPRNRYYFLGRPNTAGNVGALSEPDVNQGIPGFFTNLPSNTFPVQGLPGGTNIKYRVYAVKGVLGNSPIGPYYKVELAEVFTQAAYDSLGTLSNLPISTTFQDLSPYGIITSPRLWMNWEVDNGNNFATNSQLVYYAAINSAPNYTSFTYSQTVNYLMNPNDNTLDNGRFPLTLETDFRSVQGGYNQPVFNISPSQLVRAYIIQAYDPSIAADNQQYNGVMVQATVYGQKTILNPATGGGVEGIGNVNDGYTAYFQDEYLLVGHDYPNLGVPLSQTNGPYPGVDVRNKPATIASGEVWVKFPRRYFI